MHDNSAQGQIQDSQKGGHKYIVVNMIIVCGAHDLPNLGGLGVCPPENFEKLDPLRLNLRALLMVRY